MTDFSGQSIGRYTILNRLGQGGMATVYRALDTRLDSEVAIKFIRREAFPPEAWQRILARFEREARVLAKLNHLNIVSITDYGEFDGAPYLVMRYLSGGTLKDRLGRLYSVGEASRLLLPVARALDYAHARNVLHRDVKPGNIFMTETGEPVLGDFGIARLAEEGQGQTLTGTGVGIGTPEYMSPEQGLGKEIDARADVYSLGIVFYELVTGQKPFTASTPIEVVVKHMSEPLPDPRGFNPGLGDEACAFLARALAKPPAQRFAGMGEMAAALERLTSPPASTPVPPARVVPAEQEVPAERSVPRPLRQAESGAGAGQQPSASPSPAREGDRGDEVSIHRPQPRPAPGEVLPPTFSNPSQFPPDETRDIGPGVLPPVSLQKPKPNPVRSTRLPVRWIIAAVGLVGFAALLVVGGLAWQFLGPRATPTPLVEVVRENATAASRIEETQTSAVVDLAQKPANTVTSQAPGDPVEKIKIRVVTEAAYPPFEMVDESTKELVGFDIELMNAIADKANLEVEYVNSPFDSVIAGIATCQFDAAISAITITAERGEKMGFSDPYINAGQVTTVRLDNTDITGPADLKGKTIGVQLGTTGQIEAEKIEGATVKPYDSVDLAFLDLSNGQVDAVVADYPTTLNFVNKSKDKIKITGEVFTDESYGIAVCQKNTELLEKINKALAELKADGTLKKLEDRWLGR